MLKSRPGSRAIWNSDNELIADDFHEPAMAAVRRRLRELSDEDCTRQLWFIRASLATLSRSEDRLARSNPGFGSVGPETEAGSDSFLAAARAVGDRLASIALRDDQETTWIGLVNPFHERQLLVRPLGLILYDGQPGVLLFLAYLGALTGDARIYVAGAVGAGDHSARWSKAVGPRSKPSVLLPVGAGSSTHTLIWPRCGTAPIC